METTIKKKVSISNIEKVFDDTKICNIRYYNPLVKVDDTTDINEPIMYEIKIRHNEDENPRELFKQALAGIDKNKFVKSVADTIKQTTDNLISIENKNIVIAEYLGFQKTSIGWFDNEGILVCHEDDNTFDTLKFNKSFNWIMEAVAMCDKINSEDFRALLPLEKIYNADINAMFEAVLVFIANNPKIEE